MKGILMKQYQAYIFDMDGTALNTLTDLRVSINYALEKTGHRHDFDDRTAGLLFGSGVRVAVMRALALESGSREEDLEQVGTENDRIGPQLDEAEIDRIITVYMPHYQAHCNDRTGPYPGIDALLSRIGERGLKTAVVSNKPDPAVQKLNDVHFGGVFDFTIGESPAYARKPAPDMVLRAMEVLGVPVSEAVYIGDTEIDLETARRCGMDCIAVTWGFRTREFLKRHGAKRIVDRAEEILGES